MGSPFSLIKKADELKAAKDAYDAWLKLPLEQKQQKYEQQKSQTQNPRSNVDQQVGYIIPFGVDQAKKIYVRTKILAGGSTPAEGEEPATDLISKVTAAVITAKYALTATPTSAGVITVELNKPKFAKVKLQQIDRTARKTITSRITGRPYTYRKTDSVSCSFGQEEGGSTDYESCRKAIRTALATGDQYKVYFTSQGEVNIGVSET